MHRRVALDRGVPFHDDAARLAHPAEVVPLEVDDHHVLGTLFRIGEQLGDEGGVAAGPVPALAGALDRLLLAASAAPPEKEPGRGGLELRLAACDIFPVPLLNA